MGRKSRRQFSQKIEETKRCHRRSGTSTVGTGNAIKMCDNSPFTRRTSTSKCYCYTMLQLQTVYLSRNNIKQQQNDVNDTISHIFHRRSGMHGHFESNFNVHLCVAGIASQRIATRYLLPRLALARLTEPSRIEGTRMLSVPLQCQGERSLYQPISLQTCGKSCIAAGSGST